MPMLNVVDQPSELKNYRNEISFEERKEQLRQERLLEEQRKLAIKRAEKASPFNRWTQYNLEHTKEMMTLAIRYPRAHALLYFLVDQMDGQNAVICSYKVLQEVLGMSAPTITRSIKALKEHGFIYVLKSGTSNVYHINDDLYWKSWKNNKKYCKFPSNVVLSQNEQDKELQLQIEKCGCLKTREIVIKDKKENK